MQQIITVIVHLRSVLQAAVLNIRHVHI